MDDQAIIADLQRQLTAERSSRQQYHSLFQRMGQGYCELMLIRDAEGRAVDQRYIEFNPAFERLFGIPVTEAKGRTASEIFPGLEPWWHETFDRILARGEPERIEHEVATLGRWFEVLVYPSGADHLTVLYEDVSARQRAEQALRKSEERQAFLLTMSDALRAISDPVAIQNAACRLLADHLSTDRAYYVEIDEAKGIASVGKDYVREGSPSLAGRHPVASFSWSVNILRCGECHVVDDARTSPVVPDEAREALLALDIVACMGAPLVKDGELVGALCVTAATPRAWSETDVNLLCDVGERIWAAVERARAEAASRDSEKRFAQFAASSSDALWIRDAATCAMEYVSPAIRDIYGIPPDAILGDLRHWAALIVPEDRDTALQHLELARGGEAITHEFRILRPSDQSFRWIRNTDFPLLDDHGRVQRVGGLAADVTENKLAADHQRVLLLELQHRVRNIMAVIRSVADQTGDTVDNAEEFRERLHGRLTALARVQTLLTREANAGVDLATLVEAELSTQAFHAGQYLITGPQLQLAPKAAEVLMLAIHELATNALKYGAFSHSAGRLTVAWTIFYEGEQPWLRLDWTESGADKPLPTPRREGFGTTLVRERIPYELKGHSSLSVEPQGLRCRLELPLRSGDSILETDTVVLSSGIPGGSLDMAGEANLTGCAVLVVEDDYYLARDTARALRRAGAVVMGPVSSEAEALALIATGAPRCALVDINLGEGARFNVAEALDEKGVPFVFVTGYDDVIIPARFDAVERLRKPVELRQIVRATALMCAT